VAFSIGREPQDDKLAEDNSAQEARKGHFWKRGARSAEGNSPAQQEQEEYEIRGGASRGACEDLRGPASRAQCRTRHAAVPCLAMAAIKSETPDVAAEHDPQALGVFRREDWQFLPLLIELVDRARASPSVVEMTNAVGAHAMQAAPRGGATLTGTATPLRYGVVPRWPGCRRPTSGRRGSWRACRASTFRPRDSGSCTRSRRDSWSRRGTAGTPTVGAGPERADR